MFASRLNQENVVYEQQTAAAAKPLNQGVRGLAPKTPANKGSKTPFKAQQNDENAAKTAGKAKVLFGDGKGGKAEAAAFVTPAGPRTRAPLGNKTTNAKAAGLKTPAPATQEKASARPVSPRLRRAKVKVHQAEVDAEDEAEEREVEYMPPREVPLPDHPDDWPHDRQYPQFEGTNLTRGWWSEFAPQHDGDDEDQLSDFEDKIKRLSRTERQRQAQQVVRKKPLVSSPPLRKAFRDPLTMQAPSTVRARDAASALSKSTTPDVVPRFAASTAAARARLPSAIRSTPSASAAPASTNPRHVAAKVASNSTLGYSQGRVVSNFRRPASVVQGRQVRLTSSAATTLRANDAKEGAKPLARLFDLADMQLDDDGSGGEFEGAEEVPVAGFEIEGLEDFQLASVEL